MQLQVCPPAGAASAGAIGWLVIRGNSRGKGGQRQASTGFPARQLGGDARHAATASRSPRRPGRPPTTGGFARWSRPAHTGPRVPFSDYKP